MERPPRRLADRVIDTGMWIGILWVGFVMAVVTLAALDLRLPGGMLGGSGHDPPRRARWRSRLLCSRSSSTASTRAPTTRARSGTSSRNRLLLAAMAISRPPSRPPSSSCHSSTTPFGTAPLDFDEWLICLGLASAVLWAAEAKKLLQRRG